MSSLGPVGRLGYWMAGHVRVVVIAWVVVAAGLGVFAPRAEHALSGAGWEASGSESVAARDRINSGFGGQSGYALMVVVHGSGNLQPAVAKTTKILQADERVASVATPQVSADGRTIVLRAGATARPTVMVQAADDLKGKLSHLSGEGVSVSLTGAPGMSVLRCDGEIPLAAGAARAMAIDDADSARVVSAVHATRANGRVLAPVSVELPPGVRELARDTTVWVGERERVPPPLVTLHVRRG